MQDYDVAPGYHPLVGEGMWPDRLVNTLGLLLILAAVVLCAVAYRMGQQAGRRAHVTGRGKAPELIFAAIRKRIDIALMATGERAIGPAEQLVATAELYLGPVLLFAVGFGSLFQGLRKALATYSVEEEPKHGHHAAPVAATPGIGPFIFVTPPGGGATASATATSGPAGGNVQVVSPSAEHGHSAHGHKVKRDLTPKERARAIREALEALSDYWQKDRVEGQIKAMQDCLLIEKSLETLPAPPRPQRVRPARPEGSGFRMPSFKL